MILNTNQYDHQLQSSNLSLQITSNNPLINSQDKAQGDQAATQYTNSLAQIKRVNENLQNVYFSNGYQDMNNPKKLNIKKNQSMKSNNSSINNLSNNSSINNMSNFSISNSNMIQNQSKNLKNVQETQNQITSIDRGGDVRFQQPIQSSVVPVQNNQITILMGKNSESLVGSKKTSGNNVAKKMMVRAKTSLDNNKNIPQNGVNKLTYTDESEKIQNNQSMVSDIDSLQRLNSDAQDQIFRFSNANDPTGGNVVNRSAASMKSKSQNSNTSSPFKSIKRAQGKGARNDKIDQVMPFAANQATSVMNQDFKDQIEHQNALQMAFQNKSEIINKQNEMFSIIQNPNSSLQNNILHSAQPLDQRMMAQNNIRPSQDSAQNVNDAFKRNNLQLKVTESAIVDQIQMQQKSNKNASVKSGKRSVPHSTSATNKRKRSVGKRKITTNQMNFSNIQQNQQVKFNQMFNQINPIAQLTDKQMKKYKKQAIMSMGQNNLGKDHQQQKEFEYLMQQKNQGKTWLDSSAIMQSQTRQQNSLVTHNSVMSTAKRGWSKSPINNTVKNNQLRKQAQSANRNNTKKAQISSNQIASIMNSSNIKNGRQFDRVNDTAGAMQAINQSSLTDYNPNQNFEMQYEMMGDQQQTMLIKNHLNNISQLSQDLKDISVIQGGEQNLIDLNNESMMNGAIMSEAVVAGDNPHQQTDEQTSKLMMHRNRIENISQLSPNQIQGIFQNQAIDLNSSKNNSMSIQSNGLRQPQSSINPPDLMQNKQDTYSQPNRLSAQPDLMPVNEQHKSSNKQQIANEKMIRQQMKQSNQNFTKKSQFNSISPSQKSRQSRRSRHSRHSRQSRQSRQSKNTRLSKHSRSHGNRSYYRQPAQQKNQMNLSNPRDEDEIEGPPIQHYAAVNDMASSLKYGVQSASSKMQKKLTMQKRKMPPQTTTNLRGGARRLDPNTTKSDGNNFQNIGNMLIQNNQALNSLNSMNSLNSIEGDEAKRDTITSNSQVQQRQNQQKAKTKMISQRASKLRLDIPEDDSNDDESKMVGNTAVCYENQAQLTKKSKQSQHYDTQSDKSRKSSSNNARKKSKQILKQQMNSNTNGTKAGNNHQAKKADSKILINYQVDKSQITPKTYIFNNAKELKQQEINLSNVVAQKSNINKHQKQSLIIKSQQDGSIGIEGGGSAKSKLAVLKQQQQYQSSFKNPMFAGSVPFNKVNSDHVLNSVRRQSKKIIGGTLSQKDKMLNQQQIYGGGIGGIANEGHQNRFQKFSRRNGNRTLSQRANKAATVISRAQINQPIGTAQNSVHSMRLSSGPPPGWLGNQSLSNKLVQADKHKTPDQIFSAYNQDTTQYQKARKVNYYNSSSADKRNITQLQSGGDILTQNKNSIFKKHKTVHGQSMEYHIEPYTNSTDNNLIVIDNQNIGNRGLQSKLSRSFQAPLIEPGKHNKQAIDKSYHRDGAHASYDQIDNNIGSHVFYQNMSNDKNNRGMRRRGLAAVIAASAHSQQSQKSRSSSQCNSVFSAQSIDDLQDKQAQFISRKVNKDKIKHSQLMALKQRSYNNQMSQNQYGANADMIRSITNSTNRRSKPSQNLGPIREQQSHSVRKTLSGTRNQNHKDGSLKTYNQNRLPQTHSQLQAATNNNFFDKQHQSPLKLTSIQRRKEVAQTEQAVSLASIQPRGNGLNTSDSIASNAQEQSPFIQNYGLLNRDQKSFRDHVQKQKSIRSQIVKQIKQQKNLSQVQSDQQNFNLPSNEEHQAIVISNVKYKGQNTGALDRDYQYFPDQGEGEYAQGQSEIEPASQATYILKLKSKKRFSSNRAGNKNNSSKIQKSTVTQGNTQTSNEGRSSNHSKTRRKQAQKLNSILRLDSSYIEEDPLLFQGFKEENQQKQGDPNSNIHNVHENRDSTDLSPNLIQTSQNVQNYKQTSSRASRNASQRKNVTVNDNNVHQISGFSDFDNCEKSGDHIEQFNEECKQEDYHDQQEFSKQIIQNNQIDSNQQQFSNLTGGNKMDNKMPKSFKGKNHINQMSKNIPRGKDRPFQIAEGMPNGQPTQNSAPHNGQSFGPQAQTPQKIQQPNQNKHAQQIQQNKMMHMPQNQNEWTPHQFAPHLQNQANDNVVVNIEAGQVTHAHTLQGLSERQFQKASQGNDLQGDGSQRSYRSNASSSKNNQRFRTDHNQSIEQSKMPNSNQNYIQQSNQWSNAKNKMINQQQLVSSRKSPTKNSKHNGVLQNQVQPKSQRKAVPQASAAKYILPTNPVKQQNFIQCIDESETIGPQTNADYVSQAEVPNMGMNIPELVQSQSQQPQNRSNTMMQQYQLLDGPNGQSIRGQIKVNNFSVSGRGGAANSSLRVHNMAKTAQKMHHNNHDGSIGKVQQNRVDSRSQQSSNIGGRIGSISSNGENLQNQEYQQNNFSQKGQNRTFMNAIKVFGDASAGSHEGSTQNSQSEQKSNHLSQYAKNQNLTNANNYKVSTAHFSQIGHMKQAFNHLCTIEGDPDDQFGCHGQQAHRNTITAMCIVPFREGRGSNYGSEQINDFNSDDTGAGNLKQSMHSTKKIFSSSLDSTIKCWQFSPNNADNHRNIPIYQNGGHANEQSAYSKYPSFNREQKNLENYEYQKAYNSNDSAYNSHPFTYKFNEIQQNGRASKRIKINSLVYYPNFDILVSGGTDRFINIYENCQNQNYASMRYRCVSKISKQGAGSIIKKMCMIDNDKLIVGQSDEYIRLYQLSQMNSGSSDLVGDGGSTMASSEPLASYKFEESGINNLCSLNDQNLFISSALNRSISVWDTRQIKPILYFKDIHFDTITSIDKFNQQIFASASDDGYVNIWDLRMGEFIKQLKVENNERIASIKFVNSQPYGTQSAGTDSISAGSTSAGKPQKFLLIAHSDKVSVLSAKDNFTKRHTFKIGDSFNEQMQMTLMPPSQSHLHDYAPSLDGADDEYRVNQQYMPRSILSESNYRINQMEYNQHDKTLYLALQNIQGAPASQHGFRSVNTISMWNLDLNLL